MSNKAIKWILTIILSILIIYLVACYALEIIFITIVGGIFILFLYGLYNIIDIYISDELLNRIKNKILRKYR